MREMQKRHRLGQDTWLSFALRCVAALALYILSLAAQELIDDRGQSILLRYVSVLVYILSLSLAFTWFFLWIRRADEYQKRLAVRNVATSLINAMGFFIFLHIFYAFDRSSSAAWPILAMPAYGIGLAVIGSRPKKE
ncbi:MAG: hypothetical protein QM647_05700 [Asticcacaulis sp.]|uniref:hypothetical protein n=1 Tax=Asticcacaulis sp. TaxID=1872648 RepID=UPI0039E2D19E